MTKEEILLEIQRMIDEIDERGEVVVDYEIIINCTKKSEVTWSDDTVNLLEISE